MVFIGGEQLHLARPTGKLRGTLRGMDIRDLAEDALWDPVEKVEDFVTLEEGRRFNQNMETHLGGHGSG